MKKLLVLALVMILTFSLVACGAKEAVQDAVRDALPNSSNSSTSSSSSASSSANSTAPSSSSASSAAGFAAGEWPDNEWTQQLTEPSAGTVGNVSTAGSENQTLSIKMEWTREEAAAYCKEITATGMFDQNVLAYYADSTPMDVLLEAENADGWEVGVSITEIRIIKP